MRQQVLIEETDNGGLVVHANGKTFAFSERPKFVKWASKYFLFADEIANGWVPKIVGNSNDFAPELFWQITDSRLPMSIRAENCLVNAGIKRVADLVQCSEKDLLAHKNFGHKTLVEIKEVLAEIGLNLGMKLIGFPEPEMEVVNG